MIDFDKIAFKKRETEGGEVITGGIILEYSCHLASGIIPQNRGNAEELARDSIKHEIHQAVYGGIVDAAHGLKHDLLTANHSYENFRKLEASINKFLDYLPKVERGTRASDPA